LLSKALRQRKTGLGKDRNLDESWRAGIPRLDESSGPADPKGKGKAKEEVMLEKSNVLMMSVWVVDVRCGLC
jgi:hypothetical protein